MTATGAPGNQCSGASATGGAPRQVRCYGIRRAQISDPSANRSSRYPAAPGSRRANELVSAPLLLGSSVFVRLTCCGHHADQALLVVRQKAAGRTRTDAGSFRARAAWIDSSSSSKSSACGRPLRGIFGQQCGRADHRAQRISSHSSERAWGVFEHELRQERHHVLAENAGRPSGTRTARSRVKRCPLARPPRPPPRACSGSR